ncbi:COG4-domain-containing protein [Dentipellis sp. KUC8613]|nr:COG4-domain-containing protein [Dentipellis sp. KUC8613]
MTSSVSRSPLLRASSTSLSNLPQILSALTILESEEAELSTSLSLLFSSQEPIISSLARLQAVVPLLDDLRSQASLLFDKVSATAQTAERVGGRVRTLDEEMKRVREASERVGQVMELKTSLVALQSSIEIQDWESAARHCARAMGLPNDVIRGLFAETAVPTPENHLPPTQTLDAARKYLLEVFKQSFNEATQARDAAATTRFFKLFPAIGWEAEGLEEYASFVVDLVKVRPPASAKTSSPLYYVTALTALFESIAIIIDQHQPVVERYYGHGRMTNVITRLLQKCDRVCHGLIEGWEEERSMKCKLADTAALSFPYSNNVPANGRRQPAQVPMAEDTLDPREIDKVITEMATMAGRWNLFRRFLINRLRELPRHVGASDHEFADADAHQSPSVEEKDSLETEGSGAISKSACNELFDTLLSKYYTPLEIWYTRSAIEKAHRLSSVDVMASPATTTTPDDVFYIFKAVLSRLLSTGAATIVGGTVASLTDVMECEYAGNIKRRLDEVYRTTNVGRSDKGERENRVAFTILLNDLDVSAIHLERLIMDLMTSPTVSQNFLKDEQDAVETSISSLDTLIPKFRSILRAGIEQLFNQQLRPKLRTLLIDVYKDVSYVLDEDAYAVAEYQDTIRKRFIKAWEVLIDDYKVNTAIYKRTDTHNFFLKEIFTESNYRLFFGLTLDVLIRPWEKIVMGLKFNELGAVRFDRDLRSIITHLSSQMAFGDARDKFVRLQQVATLLNLDQEEDVDEFYNSSGIPWRLSEQEAHAIAGLKIT